MSAIDHNYSGCNKAQMSQILKPENCNSIHLLSVIPFILHNILTLSQLAMIVRGGVINLPTPAA